MRPEVNRSELIHNLQIQNRYDGQKPKQQLISIIGGTSDAVAPHPGSRTRVGRLGRRSRLPQFISTGTVNRGHSQWFHVGHGGI
jgi:hypothetical protein